MTADEFEAWWAANRPARQMTDDERRRLAVLVAAPGRGRAMGPD